ncbi:MAG: hypothetical protein U9N45_05665 [Gemmatimonadota bacterium]|nr:hypothetical protein [Gemmatimonadota bacterium]
MFTERDYINLLKAAIKTGKAAKGTEVEKDDRMLDAEGLFLKYFEHASSAFYLSRRTHISELDIDLFDIGSVNILAKASLETFLVFYFIFVIPETEEEKDFRYWSWILGGLLEKQKCIKLSSEDRSLLDKQKELIDEVKKKLTGNPGYPEFSDRQQKKLLEKGDWKLQEPWCKIGISAGLNERLARMVNEILCEFVHSKSSSLSQIHQAIDRQAQKKLLSSSLGLIMIAMAYMIKGYQRVFPQAPGTLDDDPEARALVERFYQTGSGPYEDLDIDWG